MNIASLKRSENYKAQPYKYTSPSKQILEARAEPFPPCTHCGHNHVIQIRGRVLVESSQSNESSIGVKCDTCGSTIHSTTDHNDFDHFKRHIKELIWYLNSGSSRSMTGVKSYLHKYVEQLGKFDAKADDGYFLGYSFVSKAFRVFNTRRQQIKETYHVAFDESIEAIRKYQIDSDISYYVIPHGRSLSKLTQENQVPEVIALNKPDIPHTKDTEGPPDLINTEGTHEQNDRWSRDQHIKLVNIIGDPGEGMLTRSMAANLTTTSASECLFADFLFEIEPKKVSEALKHPGCVDAMQEELNQFYRNKVWTLIPLPYGKIAIGSKWEEGIDYNETFAPVARMEAIKIFLAFATYMNFKVYQMDVKSVFLNGKLKEEVYVKQPPSFESSEFPDYVCKLDKALYGLKQEPRAWYETLFTFLIQNKFTRGRIDNTLFIYKSKGDVLVIQVYVDDIIFGSTSYKLCKQFEKLMTKKFEMSMMGELSYFRGLQIKQDEKGIFICQEHYTRNLLKKYEISDSSSVKTPMVPPNNLGPGLAGKPVNETSYRGMIGSRMYLTATRPHIQLSIVLCARYQSNPKESHLTAAKRIPRYLKGTPTLGLYYPKCSGFDLKGYSYSDYAGCNMDRKSTSVLYQNYLREFWSTSVAYDPFPSTDETEKRPLRKFLIKFLVLNGQRPLTLDFNTFCSSTDLDYNNGKYVAHPTPEAVKKELGKITINPSYLDKTLVLKNSFHVAWRILFTFVIQVLGGNYSSTEQVNSIQQLLAYYLITGTEGLEASGALFKKRQKPKSKKPPTKTKGTRKSQPLPESTTIDTKDSVGNKQPINTGLTSTASDEGKAKTTLRPERSLGDKDSRGNKSPANMEPINPTVADPSCTSAKYQVDQTQSTRLSEEDILGSGSLRIAEKSIKGPQSTMPTSKASIDEYYDENIAYRDQTDKLVEAFTSSLGKSNTTISDLYKDLNIITELLKEINNAVKDDPVINKKISEATELFTKISTNITKVLSLVKGFSFSDLQSSVNALPTHALKQDEELAAWAKSSTNMA
ncbi:retrovirus-related pol polyprotein from transposon TNT 1-94 [Tanacetum coccineum]|uniref:Retrovirus-related pol polyprotein from transposon TNT 1-94 n=1 Tax=Tanacetum coccineum TaxID=301880 RepID=A0ABQ5FZ09_9ASTR